MNPDDRGRVSLQRLPDGYILGERYRMVLAVTHPDPDRQRWGFQLTALVTEGNAPAGMFPVTVGDRGVADPVRTQREIGGPGGRRQYMSHTSESTGDFPKRGGDRWEIAWDAPATDVGAITFYAAGNAANGDFTLRGDKIFTAAFSIRGTLRFLRQDAFASGSTVRSIRAAAWGDFDGDGRVDLFLIGEGEYALFRNEGGRLVDVTMTSGIPRAGTGRAAAWGDYDGDGRLDLYVVTEGQDLLFRNEGSMFRDVTVSAGIVENAAGRAAAWRDFDGDGRLDLYVVNEGQDALYRNRGDGTFQLLDPDASGLREEAAGRAAAWGDFDGDGRADLYVANEGADRLYRNLGGGRFQDVTTSARILQGGISTDVSWLDFDGDGRLDLFVVREGQDRLYRNRGDGSFDLLDPEVVGYRDEGSGGLVAVADFDGDGRVDLTVVKIEALFLFRNRGDGTFSSVAGRVGVEALASPRGVAWGDFDGDGLRDLLLVDAEGAVIIYRKKIGT